MTQPSQQPFHNEFELLEDWCSDVIAQHPGIIVEPPSKRTVLFGCVPSMYWSVKTPRDVKPIDVINTIMVLGKKYSKHYRFWFVFDKTKGFIILQFYPYLQKNVPHDYR